MVTFTEEILNGKTSFFLQCMFLVNLKQLLKQLILELPFSNAVSFNKLCDLRQISVPM